MSRLRGVGIFLWMLALVSLNTKAHANTGSYSIIKVDQRNIEERNMGRHPRALGYPSDLSFDKFYTAQELSDHEKGETYVVAWRCHGIADKGEKITLQLEYRTTNDPQIKKKDLDVIVDKDGFYETAIDHRGEEYLKEGSIDSWKIILLRDGQVLDRDNSSFWSDGV